MPFVQPGTHHTPHTTHTHTHTHTRPLITHSVVQIHVGMLASVMIHFKRAPHTHAHVCNGRTVFLI